MSFQDFRMAQESALILSAVFAIIRPEKGGCCPQVCSYYVLG
jgi:hypothetical protein